MCDQQWRDRAHDLILNRENVVEFAVVALAPEMGATFRIHQLRRDAHAIIGAANTALQHVTYAQLAPDLTFVDRLALVMERRMPSDYLKLCEVQQLVDNAVTEAVSQIILLGNARKGLERH